MLRNPPSGITPLPLFEGDKAALTAALKAAGRKVTQAGYPEDHLDTLYSCLLYTSDAAEESRGVDLGGPRKQ